MTLIPPPPTPHNHDIQPVDVQFHKAKVMLKTKAASSDETTKILGLKSTRTEVSQIANGILPTIYHMILNCRINSPLLDDQVMIRLCIPLLPSYQ